MLLAVVSALMLFAGSVVVLPTQWVLASSLLMSDNFEADALGTAPQGWTPIGSSAWLVEQDGSHVLQQTSPSTSTKYEITAGDPTWMDYSFSADVKPGANDLNQSTVLEARFVDTNNHYSFLLKNKNEWWLGRVKAGTWSTFAVGTFPYASQFYAMAISVQGQTITATLNGSVLATVTDSAFSSGMIAFSAKAQAELDNVSVAPLGTAPTPTPSPTATSTTPTPTPSPSPTPTTTPSPTPSPTPIVTPPADSGDGAALSATVSGSGVLVRSLDADNNGWQMFFNSGAGGVISTNGEIDHGTYTELEAQNTIHGRIQMYYQTSGSIWLGNLQNAGTVTLLVNTPRLVEVRTYSANTDYHLQWTTTYCIWPNGMIYVQLQTSNTGTKALTLNTGDSLELDLGGLPLAFYQDIAPNAWYSNAGQIISPIPTTTKNVEARLFGHATGNTSILPNMGYLLDKYTTWASQGATSHGIAENQNSSRAKDKWLANLTKINPGQTLTFLFLFDQQRLLTSAQTVALDADYRTPGITVSVGTLATSDTEPSAATVIGGFNMNLGAYVIAASNNRVNAQLTLPSGVTTRFAPRLKITGWTSASPTITWGGEPLAEGTDYTYTIDQATHTLYVRLSFDVVAANPGLGQRVNAPLAISPSAIP